MEEGPPSNPLSAPEQIELFLEQTRWLAFHTARLESVVENLDRKVQTLRRSVLRLLALYREQRTFLNRIDSRVGQLEERFEVAIDHSADHADRLDKLESITQQHFLQQQVRVDSIHLRLRVLEQSCPWLLQLD